MFTHTLDQIPKRIVVLHWFMLSFNGGFINAGGFLATGRFVSHVTGFATLFGVDLLQKDAHSGFGMLAVPLFFLAGAFIAGLLIERPLHKKQKPHFDWVMGLSAFCLFWAATAGELMQFGNFGVVSAIGQDFGLLALLCMACGLQNGAITSSSSRTVRTTHLTGLTTDLGLGLARVLTLELKQILLEKETRANYLRFGSIVSYIVGSAVGALLFIKLGYKGFFLSALISAYAAWHGRAANTVRHQGEIGPP